MLECTDEITKELEMFARCTMSLDLQKIFSICTSIFDENEILLDDIETQLLKYGYELRM